MLESEQVLPIRLKDAWEFFSTPLNLASITPSDMRFEILSKDADKPIFDGMRIDYRVRPILGIPVRWTSVIRNVERLHSFTDLQVRGPFAKWEHHHRFVDSPYGVIVKDRVLYKLPLGPLGGLVHTVLVRGRLEAIFKHRERALNAIFA
ncbi:MAG: SRPBCC family protein [Flavobacteriales bacterium]|nr:SRPBCC family protein [Flavobacteriales bacterium]